MSASSRPSLRLHRPLPVERHSHLGRRGAGLRGREIQLAGGNGQASHITIATEVGLGALRLRVGGGDARPLLLHLGAVDRDLGDGLVGLAAGRGEFGAGLVELRLVVARIDFEEHGALPNLLIVGNRDAEHASGDLRRNRRHVRLDERVVGRLVRGDERPIVAAQRGARDESRGPNEEGAPATRLDCAGRRNRDGAYGRAVGGRSGRGGQRSDAREELSLGKIVNGAHGGKMG